MKCPSCGAEIGSGKVCEFCGTHISSEMQREQEQLNKQGCPKCGSSNITFSREKRGEVKGKKGTAVVRATVGLCKDCGYTWYTEESGQPKQRKTWLWVLGWICIFPLPLTILMLRNKKLKPAIKYGIIAVAWIIYLIIGFSGRGSDKTNTSGQSSVSSETTQQASQTKDEMAALQKFYDDFRANGTYANLRDMVEQHGLYSDSRKDGIGYEYFKVAFTKELARVTSNSDLEPPGNYVVIKVKILGDNSIESVTFHTDAQNGNARTSEQSNSDYAVVDSFVSKYNATASKQLTDGIEIDIKDKEYYKTEFRLGAFSNAKAKRYAVDGEYIIIINYGSMKNDNIRMYLDTDNQDLAIEVFDAAAKVLKKDLTADDLETAHQNIISHKNGNYIGHIGYYFFGKPDGLFIDCTDIDFYKD